jgi:hypothetical protein
MSLNGPKQAKSAREWCSGNANGSTQANFRKISRPQLLEPEYFVIAKFVPLNSSLGPSDQHQEKLKLLLFY